MPTVEVWVVLGEDGSCEVATDEGTALARLKDGSDDDLVGTPVVSSGSTLQCLSRATATMTTKQTSRLMCRSLTTRGASLKSRQSNTR
jgi:hypothetical protein